MTGLIFARADFVETWNEILCSVELTDCPICVLRIFYGVRLENWAVWKLWYIVFLNEFIFLELEIRIISKLILIIYNDGELKSLIN